MKYRSGRSVLEKYRCEAVSVTGFVQRLVDYLRRGYWFYVTGEVPPGKDPREIDEKLLEKYRIAVSDTTRYRRKRAMPRLANMQYIRHGRFFVLLCTYGKHDFFLPLGDGGGESVRDEQGREKRIRFVRAVPIRYAGYSISVREGGNLRKVNPEDPPQPGGRPRVSVRIDEKTHKDLKARLMRLGLSRKRDVVEKAFRRVPFEPYAPVRRQLLRLVNTVNERRKKRGFTPLRMRDSVRWRINRLKPFGERGEGAPEAA